MLIAEHLGVGGRDLIPCEDFGHAWVQTTLHHQLVGSGGLLQVGKVGALQTLLVHPHIAHVEGAVEAGGAGADHDHAALFANQRGDGERGLTRVLEHHVHIVALAGEFPDGLAELAGLFQPRVVFGAVHRGQLAPAVEVLAVDHALGALIHHELALALVRDHADRVGANGVGELDRVGAEATGGPPDQNVLARLQLMGVMAKQHPVGGGQRQRIAGSLFPSQVLGARHQLLGLHLGELAEGAVRRLIAPDALGGGEHRITAVAVLVIAVILVAVDHDLIANLPVANLVAHLPHDARRVGPGDVVGLAVAVKGADRLAEAGPDTVIVHACSHHEDEHFVAVDLPGVDDLLLEGLLRLAVAILTDGPSVHLGRHVADRGHFADFVEIFLFGVVSGGHGLGVLHGHSLSPVGDGCAINVRKMTLFFNGIALRRKRNLVALRRKVQKLRVGGWKGVAHQ